MCFEKFFFDKFLKALVRSFIIKNFDFTFAGYAYLPLAIRSIVKLNQLIDQHMQEIHAQKILLPTMTDGVLWKKSGRWDSVNDELFKLKNRHEQDLILGPTYEEAITSLVASVGIISERMLPLKLYQISTKFRDEMKSKFGLIRSKEFIMKDLYTFDASHETAMKTYMEVMDVYSKLFQTLNIPYICVDGHTGSIGGTLSHEYHFISEIGQDELIICQNCGFGNNVELHDNEKCLKCDSSDIKRTKGIEVGHTFFLGDKYSKIFKAKFMTKEGKSREIQMGCYGLGVSRIMAAALEVLSVEENRLRWPKEIVPYKVIIIAPKSGSKESVVMDKVFNLYDLINGHKAFSGDVIIDDIPGMTVGLKLRNAKKMGYPFIILFGKESINSVIELYDYRSMIKIPIDQVLVHLKSINISA